MTSKRIIAREKTYKHSTKCN